MNCQCLGARVVLKTRIITAIVMLIVLYMATVWTTPFQFSVFVSLALLVAILEWTGLMGLQSAAAKAAYLTVFVVIMGLLASAAQIFSPVAMLSQSVVLTLTGVGVLFWLLAFWLIRHFPENTPQWATTPKTAAMGLLTLIPTWIALIQLKYLAPSGALVFALIALVSIVDIGAYFTGKALGKAKLAPKLSPGKSWAGFWGGMASCLVLAVVLLYPLNMYVVQIDGLHMAAFLVVAMVTAVFSVLGDLFESMLKRSQGLKDSGKSLPGHGGILDRIDSLTAAAPVFVFFLLSLFADVTWP